MVYAPLESVLEVKEALQEPPQLPPPESHDFLRGSFSPHSNELQSCGISPEVFEFSSILLCVFSQSERFLYDILFIFQGEGRLWLLRPISFHPSRNLG